MTDKPSTQRAWVGEPDYEAAARAEYEFHRKRMIDVWEAEDKVMILDEWSDLFEPDRERKIDAMKRRLDAALSSMTQIEVTQIHGGFTDTDEHEFTQWISEWEKEET